MTDAGCAAPAPSPTAAADMLRMAVAIALAGALLAWGAANVWPFFADDAFISLRYAQRLLAGHGLTWNDGERVEGFSNPLWTLLCAGLGACGLDLATAARALGIACTAATVALLAWRLRRSWAAALCVPAFAAVPDVAVWTIGGLELPLVWLSTTAGLLLVERALAGQRPRRARVAAGACFAAACLSRPDAPLFAVLAALAVAARAARRSGPAAAARAGGEVLLLPALALLGWLAFRLAYYGDWLPNTARVKLGFGLDLLGGGLAYLGWALPAHLALLLPAAFALVAGARPALARGAMWTLATGAVAVLLAALVGGDRVTAFGGWPFLAPALLALVLLLAAAGRRLAPADGGFARLLAASALAWAAYLASVGGDIFPGWRLLSPAVPPLLLLGALGVERLAADARPWPAVAVAIALLAAASARIASQFDGETKRAATELWERDYQQAGRTLAQAFGGRQPRLAVNAAGALCFFSQLPSLDMYGLNDRAIARDPFPDPDARRRGALGAAHRRGRPEYLLARAPDLVNFDTEAFPADRAGRALLEAPAFVRDYRCVWFRCADRSAQRPGDGEYVLPFWVRVDGRIGVKREGGTVRVPAWLLGSFALPPSLRLPDPDDAAAKLAWAQAAGLLPWLGRAAVVRLVDRELVLEVRRGDLHALRGLHLDAGPWRATLAPAVPGCEVELADQYGMPLPRDGDAFQVGAVQADDVQLCVRLQAIAVTPVRIAVVELTRR